MAKQVETRTAETWVLIATIVASAMSFISTSVLNIALASIQKDLNATGTQILWIINADTLLLSALILVGGSLGDHYGRKRVFSTGVVVFTLASALCGIAPNSEFLIGVRALQGIGGAMMVPGSLAIISATFPEDRRGKAIGTWSTFATLTTLLAPVIGGELAERGLWRAIFFINVPLAVIVIYALRFVPESRDETADHELDYLGAALVTLGLAGITYGFTQISDYGLSDPRILVSLIGGMLALGSFIWHEGHSKHPMMPLSLFKSHTFSGANALTLFLYAALSGTLFFLPLNLIQVQGYGSGVAGRALLPFSILLTLMSRWAGGLIDRVGAQLPLMIGPAIVGVGFFLLGLPGITEGAKDYWVTYFPAILIMGVGMGIVVAPLTTAVMGAAPSEKAGTASGINNTVARAAGVLAIAIMGALALLTFSTALEARADDLPLTEEARIALDDEASKLADANVPEIIQGDSLRADVQQAIHLSFIESFRLMTRIGAALAWISAFMAWLLIEPRQKRKNAEAGGQP